MVNIPGALFSRLQDSRRKIWLVIYFCNAENGIRDWIMSKLLESQDSAILIHRENYHFSWKMSDYTDCLFVILYDGQRVREFRKLRYSVDCSSRA